MIRKEKKRSVVADTVNEYNNPNSDINWQEIKLNINYSVFTPPTFKNDFFLYTLILTIQLLFTIYFLS